MRTRASPNGSEMKIESGPIVNRPRRRQRIEYDTVSWLRGGSPATTSRADVPSEWGSASSRRRKGAVTLLWLVIVRLTTTRVPGNTRTIERFRWTSSRTLLQCTNAAARNGITEMPAATMCRSGEPMNRATIHREMPAPNAAHPRLVGMDQVRSRTGTGTWPMMSARSEAGVCPAMAASAVTRMRWASTGTTRLLTSSGIT